MFAASNLELRHVCYRGFSYILGVDSFVHAA